MAMAILPLDPGTVFRTGRAEQLAVREPPRALRGNHSSLAASKNQAPIGFRERPRRLLQVSSRDHVVRQRPQRSCPEPRLMPHYAVQRTARPSI